nr:hypothetical protein [Tanacetum cinerariifolium]
SASSCLVVPSTTSWAEVPGAALAHKGTAASRTSKLRRRIVIMKRPSFGVFIDGIEHEFTDQVFEHQRRLCVVDGPAIGEQLVVAAHAEADVFLAQQAGSENRRSGVDGQVVDLLVQLHRHSTGEVVAIQIDGRDLADAHTGHGHLGSDRQTGNIVEVGVKFISVGVGAGGQSTDTQGQKQQSQDPGQ